MQENPKEMTLAKLDVLVMPNGEILCEGLTIGWVKQEVNIAKKLSDFRSAITGQPVNERGELNFTRGYHAKSKGGC
jgi:hypothetical protein